MRFPDTVDGLIAALDVTFPEPAIGPNDTMDKIKFEAGQRSVITHLKTWRKNGNRPVPEPPKRGQGRKV